MLKSYEFDRITGFGSVSPVPYRRMEKMIYKPEKGKTYSSEDVSRILRANYVTESEAARSMIEACLRNSLPVSNMFTPLCGLEVSPEVQLDRGIYRVGIDGVEYLVVGREGIEWEVLFYSKTKNKGGRNQRSKKNREEVAAILERS